MVIPSDARPFLRDLNSRAAAHRLQGLLRLAECGDWTLQGLAAPQLDDPDLDVRVAALLALRAIGDRRWAERALAGLADPDPRLRGASAALLAALGPSPDEAGTLLARAGDLDWEVVRGLLDLASRRAPGLAARLPAWLPGALADPEPAVRRTAALILEAAPDRAHAAALERLREDLAPAPFATSALDAWLAERELEPRPSPAARVATVSEAASRALAALARNPARARRRRAGDAPRATAHGWEVLFAYRRLPPAVEVAVGIWPGLDHETIVVRGEMNPAGHHWVSANLAPRARRGEGPVRLRVVRRDDLISGRLAFEPDPRLPSLAVLDAKLAARPGADAVLLVETREPGGKRAEAARAAEWLAEALEGLAAGPWVREVA